MSFNGCRSTMETEDIIRHHKHEPREDQCSSALVKHIKAPVHLMSLKAIERDAYEFFSKAGKEGTSMAVIGGSFRKAQLRRLGQVESAGRHLFWPGLQPDVVELQKLQSVDMHVRRCADAQKIGDLKIVLSESNAAKEVGADSSSLLITAKAEVALLLHQLEEADSTISLALKLEISSLPSS